MKSLQLHEIGKKCHSVRVIWSQFFPFTSFINRWFEFNFGRVDWCAQWHSGHRRKCANAYIRSNAIAHDFHATVVKAWHGEGHNESYRGLLFVFEHNAVVRIILIKLPRWGGQERYALDSLWDVLMAGFHWIGEESGHNNDHSRLNWVDVLLKRSGFSIKNGKIRNWRKHPSLAYSQRSAAHTHTSNEAYDLSIRSYVVSKYTLINKIS